MVDNISIIEVADEIDFDGLMALHDEACGKARNIMRAKNHDYTNAGDSVGGVFGNLALCEMMGICETQQGILIRLTDKLSRLATLTTKEVQVKDEKDIDTVIDVINYLVLFLAARGVTLEDLQDV